MKWINDLIWYYRLAFRLWRLDRKPSPILPSTRRAVSRLILQSQWNKRRSSATAAAHVGA
jgi:hypothetical protein